MIPLVNHPRYKITAFRLERLHPFDSRKYRRIHDALTARGLQRPRDFVRPRPVPPAGTPESPHGAHRWSRFLSSSTRQSLLYAREHPSNVEVQITSPPKMAPWAGDRAGGSSSA